ncbi:hypothetical protein TYRP_002766 [Tyrophagus putrescentiae]|nr:hypothetical protein TYRP_002766 [Tyrophagus putrescentiae]
MMIAPKKKVVSKGVAASASSAKSGMPFRPSQLGKEVNKATKHVLFSQFRLNTHTHRKHIRLKTEDLIASWSAL